MRQRHTPPCVITIRFGGKKQTQTIPNQTVPHRSVERKQKWASVFSCRNPSLVSQEWWSHVQTKTLLLDEMANFIQTAVQLIPLSTQTYAASLTQNKHRFSKEKWAFTLTKRPFIPKTWMWSIPWHGKMNGFYRTITWNPAIFKNFLWS